MFLADRAGLRVCVKHALACVQLVDRATAMEQMDEYQKEMEEQGLSASDVSGMAGGMGGGEL